MAPREVIFYDEPMAEQSSSKLADSSSALVRLINKILTQIRYPVLVCGSICFLILMGFYISTDSMHPDDIEPFASNPMEITGVLILLAVMPSYLLMCILGSTRLTNRVIVNLKEQLGESYSNAGERYRHVRFWPLVLAACVFFSWKMNINWEPLSFDYGDERFWLSFQLVFGQLFMWGFVGILLYLGILDSLHIHRIGKITEVDLYELDKLNGFGRVASNWFLVIVGAMAITTIQSLDQTFDLEDYVSALIVVVPSILILVPLPIWSIHRRIRIAKSEELQRIESEISSTARDLGDDALHRMNGLMTRKEQISKLRNWPMDLSIFSRFVLYVFIPPLAWAGAAFMEFYLDSVLGG